LEPDAKTGLHIRGHIPALDGVRGFAAASVFILHYGGGAQSSFLPLRAIGVVSHMGWAGVSLFFVLSGFLISGILWDGYHKPGWWKRFYIRRSLRIFPLYYLTIVLAFVYWVATGTPVADLKALWVYLCYLSDVPLFQPQIDKLPISLPFIHFWSLAVEEQFYLFWPFLLALFVGRRRGAVRMCAILWALSLLFRIGVLESHIAMEWGTKFLLGRAGELIAGAYIAMVVRGDREERQQFFSKIPWLLPASLIALVAVTVLGRDTTLETPWMATAGLAVCSILSACVVGACLQPGRMQQFFSIAPLRWLGKISYGFYVYHLFISNKLIEFTYNVWPNMDRNKRLGVVFFIGLAATLAIASLSFYTYESFFLRLKDRLTGKPKASLESAQS
jgi:peptidoglycan/LPS O-acetylase OafA/YrhL